MSPHRWIHKCTEWTSNMGMQKAHLLCPRPPKTETKRGFMGECKCDRNWFALFTLYNHINATFSPVKWPEGEASQQDACLSCLKQEMRTKHLPEVMCCIAADSCQRRLSKNIPRFPRVKSEMQPTPYTYGGSFGDSAQHRAGVNLANSTPLTQPAANVTGLGREVAGSLSVIPFFFCCCCWFGMLLIALVFGVFHMDNDFF